MKDISTKRKIREDLTGQRFGRWTVVSYAGYDHRHLWRVICACGGSGIVGEYQLKNGLSGSCGCGKREAARRVHTVHGESAAGKRSPEFRAYLLAKNQCENPAHENYGKFGGRGIEFCFNSFAQFIAAVGRKPEKSYVLTRIDKSGHYRQGNIEWTKNKNRKL